VLNGLLRDKGLQSSTVAPWPSLQNFAPERAFSTEGVAGPGKATCEQFQISPRTGLCSHSRELIPTESLLPMRVSFIS
jgi:hypothetical protein